jgi:IMP dehydrogenase
MVKILKEDSTTFAEYLVLPRLTNKECVHKNISLRTPLTKYNANEGIDSAKITLNLPFLSASMQAVTGPRMAIAMAQEGCLGIIYCSQPIEKQAEMIGEVKSAKAGFVRPKTLSPNQTVDDAFKKSRKEGHSIYPIADENGNLLGTVNINYLMHCSAEEQLSGVMRKFMQQNLEEIVERMKTEKTSEDIIKAVREYIPFAYKGIELGEANDLIQKTNSKFLAIIDKSGKLESLVFRKDIRKHLEHPNELTDANKRHMCGAGINTHDYRERIPALIEAGADILCIDSSDAFSEYTKECLLFAKKHYGNTPIIGGNIVTGEAFDYLVKECDADAIKVGMGGGSICITRDKKGVGRGQADAVLEICRHRNKYLEETGIYVPVYSDGSHREANDIVIALVFGADGVMGGRIFAGAEESPAPFNSKNRKYKEYWGEGSSRARNWQRYSEGDAGTLKFEEGVDGLVPYAGQLENILTGLTDIIKSTMINSGAKSIKEFQEKAHVVHLSELSRAEGHPSVMLKENGADYKS